MDNQYSSNPAAILTMIGVAVGLGNIWRFPYMMGSYGGSAFVLIYIAFIILLVFPALVTEMYLGQTARSGTVSAYISIYGKRWGTYLGYLLVGVVTISGSYYAVIVANVFFTAAFSMLVGFSELNNLEYQNLLANGIFQYAATTSLVILALWVCYKGLENGIEKISKVIMPFFLISMIYMIWHAWALPGAIDAAEEFMKPNFEAIGYSEVFAALGQAFFSLGLGGTFVVVYSAYIRDHNQIPKIAILTCLGDLSASLLAALFLIPTILVLGLELNAGPALVFNTLPELFSIMPEGRWIGSLFLISLCSVAFLSLVAAFQVPLSSLKNALNRQSPPEPNTQSQDRSLFEKFSRKQLFLLFGALQMLLTMPSTFFPEIIGVLDLLFGSGMQVFGSLLAVIGMWSGIKRGFFEKLIFPDGQKTVTTLFSILWLRWVVPVVLLSILASYVIENL